MPTVFGYARGSTGEQLDTLVIQQKATEAEYHHRFKAEGFAWGGCFTDQGVSGSTRFANRPEAFKLNLKLERGDVCIIAKLDRGFRNALDFFETFERMKTRGVGLVMLDMKLDTTTPEGEMMAGMLAVLAQWERRRIGERMKEFFAKRKAEGRPYASRPPYGFKYVGPKGNRQFAPDPVMRAFGKKIVMWRDGGLSIEAIYFHMIRERVKTPDNKEWSYGRISTIYVAETKLQRAEALQRTQGAASENETDPTETQQPPPAQAGLGLPD